MTTEIDVCNLALSLLGDSATVASIDPPEGSAQAEHCARWFPFARDVLLQAQEWDFATTRAPLAELVNAYPQWTHAYARPLNCLKVLQVLPPDAAGDTAATYEYDRFNYAAAPFPTMYTSQPFGTETDVTNGNQIILTNQRNALVRYTRSITDVSKFSPMFVDALIPLLASYLAGPVLKGETGMKVAQSMKQMAMQMSGMAAVSSANQQAQMHVQSYPWSR